MRKLTYALMVAAATALPASAMAQTFDRELNIGLGDDPGSLDPATNASFVGRVSLQSVCDKLVDIDVKGNLVPMLATAWDWAPDGKSVTLTLRQNVVFHDGEPFNAASVKFNLDRFLTMEGSRRRSEISVIDKVVVVDPYKVRLDLKEPSVSLLFQFTDRAGMMVSQKAYEATTPAKFATAPVCAGPFKLAEYKPQERVVIERFPQHWRANEYHFDKVVYEPIPDGNVRLLNVRAGQLDLVEQIPPNAVPSIEKEPNLKVSIGDQPAYQMLVFNLNNGPGANPDIAKHRQVREAISLAIDRKAINQVIAGGRYGTGNQPFPTTNPWYDERFPVLPRNVAAAKAKLKEVGLDKVTFEILVSTDPENQQVAQVMQAMLAEAGITMNIKAMEFISMRAAAARGAFQSYIVGSSGRVDPDLNISLTVLCGTANNVGKYCNEKLDAALAKARSKPDVEFRKAAYKEVMDIIMTDLPLLYLYNQKTPFAHKAGLKGFQAFPDGIIRLEGVSLQN
jgi:peptide/nickel transport system substrate-binding protein